MAELVKPWNDGGNLSVTYDGDGDGSAVFSSDVAEGLDRDMIVVFRDGGKTVAVERKVLQIGMREMFVPSDGDFVPSEGGSFNVLKGEKLQNTYFTITALEDGLQVSMSMVDVEYSLNSGVSWSWLNVEEETPAINSGESIMFRAELTPVQNKGIGICYITKKAALSGTPMSLLYGDNAADHDSVPAYAFYNLFYNSENIVTVSDDFLPATTLGERCYYQTFYRCTNLKNAPILPALEVKDRCYNAMFNGCISLLEAPALPATKLAPYCYYNMFYNCTSLAKASDLPATELTEYCYYNMYRLSAIEEAPVLPAKELVSNCYNSMFRECANLRYIKALFTTTPNDTYTKNWVYGIASEGTFIKNKDATWNVNGKNGIPSGWTILTE